MNNCFHKIQIYLRYFICWLLLFTTFRIIFLVANRTDFSNQNFSQVLLVFKYAIALDFSTTGYLFLFFSIPMFISFFVKHTLANKIFLASSFVVYFIYALISISELVLYKEWGTKLNYKALKYILEPTEILQTASTSKLVIGFIGVFLFSLFFLKITQIFVLSVVSNNLKLSIKNFAIASTFFILNVIAGIFIMRGGFQQIPIQSGVCYYSTNNTLNNAAVNNLWNVGHSIFQNKDFLDKNPYIKMSNPEAKSIVSLLYKTNSDNITKILTTNKPNIVFIQLEGLSADCLKATGGDSYAKNLDGLCKHGITFTNIFASGTRSDEGLAANFAAFPDQPPTSIITQPSKYANLPCIAKDFKNKGYYTSFYFGGQLEYENIKSYLVYNQFEHLVDIQDFSNVPQGKLGAHDQYTLQKWITEIPKMPQPFFTVLFTTSTHSPYDVPSKPLNVKNLPESAYLESVAYSDSCLGVFFNNAKKQTWFANTLFVIISDHSKRTHRQHPWDSPGDRHIPFILYGNVIKKDFKGLSVNKIGSQTDLASTLLYQCDMETEKYTWSKNLLSNSVKDFAYYSNTVGFGFVTSKDTFSFYYNQYPNNFNQIHSTNKDSIIKIGQAYLQVLFNQYLSF